MHDEIRTTAGAVALGNLQAQIDGQKSASVAGQLTVSARAGFIDLVALRGHLLGRIADYEWAGALADQLVQDAPTDGDALLSRARTRAVFHRFEAALADLDEAGRRGADPMPVDAERAAIFQAIGQDEQPLAICRAAVERRADFHSLGGLATLYAERGEIAAAENLFSESRGHYRGVSPIPLAQLDFKRAQMWMAQGDLPQARRWLDAAVRRLPGYAPAAGHLAEVEAASGDTCSAIARLRPLASSTDDPDYAAQFARVLGETGASQEAGEWRARAAARYDELVARHLEAFADHAATFWLDTGEDPRRALWLARKNLELRPTKRAHDLVARAMLADAESVSGNYVGTATTWR